MTEEARYQPSRLRYRPKYAILGPNAELKLETDSWEEVTSWLELNLGPATMFTIARYW